jgi:formate dehydrogenase subunit gamma
MKPAANTDTLARVACADHGDRPDALIEILHAVQAQAGHVPDAVVPVIAEALNLSRADVHGVLSFYHDFRRQPGAPHRLQLCRAEACQAMGCEDLARLAGQAIEANGDDAVAVDKVYCLGNCALAPAAMLDGRLVGRLDAARLEALLSSCREATR